MVTINGISYSQAQYNVADAARLLGISRETLYALMRANKIPWSAVGTQRRISASSIQAYISGTLAKTDKGGASNE